MKNKTNNGVDKIYQHITESYYRKLKSFDTVDDMREYICKQHVPERHRKYWWGAAIKVIDDVEYCEDHYYIIHYVKPGAKVKFKIKED